MIEQMRIDMGLDGALTTRYVRWVRGLFSGKIGVSLYSSKEISSDLTRFVPVTCALVLMSLLWIVLLSVPASLLCARFRNGVIDAILGS